MRILLLSQLLPLPLDAGPKVRSFYVLRYLVEAGHDVTVACFVRPNDHPDTIAEVGRSCSRVETVPLIRSRLRDVRDGALSLASSTPFLVRRDSTRPMASRVAALMASRSFDAIHVDQLWMSPYVDHCAGLLKVLDQHNAVFRVPERLAEHQRNPLVRLALRREARTLAAFERATLDRFDRVVWVTAEDRQAVVRDTRRADPIIPIAVDPMRSRVVARPRPFRVTFLGGMHWPPNAEGAAWFGDAVWPAVADAVPECVLTVIGRGSPAAIGPPALRARVEVTGYLPDLARHLAETAVFIVPLRSGAGMRVKILDAWCWGLPVVSTSLGAEGIEVASGENALVADAPDAFADAVIHVLQDRALAARLGRGGRATAESQYDWRGVYPAWDRIYH